MAINKNFVIKNGVEVNTNLLVGDSTLSKVGIATTVPGYTLHIGVGAGDRGGIGATDLTVTGVATIGTQNSTSGALNVGGISTFSGDIFVGSGATIQANGNVAFAGIGTIGGDLNVGGNLNAADFTIDEITARNINVTGFATFSAIGGNLIPDSDGTHNIGAAGSEWQDLFIDGTANLDILDVDGASNFGADVVFAGAAANITFDQSTDDLIFDDGAQAFFGSSSDGLAIVHDGSNSFLAQAGTGNLHLSAVAGKEIIIEKNTGEKGIVYNVDGAVEIFHDGAPTLFTTGIGITVGLTTLQSNGNAAFAGITTIGGNADFNGDLDVDGATTLDGLTVAEPAAFSDNVTISGVTTTGENLGGFKRLVGAASSTVVSIAVTVATKTADHRYFGQGSGNGYWLDGVESPFITLVPGKLYFFDQSHSTNGGHPLRFYLEQDKANAYTTEITSVGTAGQAGAYTKIGIGTASNENNHPAVLHYQCSSHALMGNAVATQSNAVNLPDSVVTTVRGNLLPGADSSYDIGSNGVRFQNIYGDTLYGDGSNLTNLPTQVSIANNADNRVITGGSGVNLNGEANLTFDGSTLGITGSIDLSADIDVDGTANLDVLDVDGASNFGADVTFTGSSANIIFDQSDDALEFNDDAKATFGTDADTTFTHSGADFAITNTTGNLNILNNANAAAVQIRHGDEMMIKAVSDAEVQLYHNNIQTLFTTGIGITVGLTTLQRNGNAAFAGITTVGDILDVNGRIDAASGANISGIATITNAYITKLAQSNGTSGNTNEVPVANGSGGWNWAPVNTAGASDIQGITVQEEGSNVGTAGSINTINFTGSDITASASGQTATVNVSSNIQGISTANQSYLHDITQTGVTTITSDQEAAINVGTSATIYKLGNIRTVGVITARGGLVISDSTDRSSNGGLIVGTAGTIQSNGAAAFAGIVTAGGGFNIGIQSAGIVIAKNVGINTLNFVGSGNSITYFAATNTLDVSIAGSSGGGGGGVSETETAVSSTSATSTGSFAKASFRSASILAQITQGSAYQVGRYLLIHDGTTVTTIEESAIATGSMLGTFEGVINGSDVEFRVTMSSSSSATVTTKIDTISIP